MTSPRLRPTGPHPGLVALSVLLLALAGVVVPALVTGAPGWVHPQAARPLDDAIARSRGLMLSGFFLAGASIPLVVCAATWAAALRRRGVRVPGPVIALGGGVLAASALLASGLEVATLGALAGRLDGPSVLLLTVLSFHTGGVGFALPLGLLVAGIAVPGLLARALPRGLAWAGLVLAIGCEATWLVLLVPSLAVLLPVARFGGLLWLVVAGFVGHRRGRESA